eukprot:SAG31_NODE_12222_length_957_cov_20.146853_1_plen_33_part_10
MRGGYRVEGEGKLARLRLDVAHLRRQHLPRAHQ